jgi:hypothetical protein
MGNPFNGTINIDIKDSTPDWTPYAQATAARGPRALTGGCGSCLVGVAG